jgi:LysR family transcriptional regulator, glycine cleavage system transcriptional activator
MRRLPPLNALKAFEAAARHESYSRAAAELCVTHGAISKHVYALEASLGVRLFERTSTGVTLTRAGRLYASEIGLALDRVADATARMCAQKEPGSLEINAPPTFTIQWLVPRLSRFQVEHPGLEIRLKTGRHAAQAAVQESDAVVRRGPERWRGYVSRPLMKEAVTPVCSPRLLRQQPVRTPADLQRHTWLHAEARPDDWAVWLAHIGANGLTGARNVRFDHNSLALEAAADGLGFAMAPIAMIGNELASRTLVMPFPERIAPTPGYYFLCEKEKARRSGVQRFASWLARECQASEGELQEIIAAAQRKSRDQKA